MCGLSSRPALYSDVTSFQRDESLFRGRNCKLPGGINSIRCFHWKGKLLCRYRAGPLSPPTAPLSYHPQPPHRGISRQASPFSGINVQPVNNSSDENVTVYNFDLLERISQSRFRTGQIPRPTNGLRIIHTYLVYGACTSHSWTFMLYFVAIHNFFIFFFNFNNIHWWNFGLFYVYL